MKKLTLTPEQQLIEAKYQFPATVTTFKNGTPISKRVVTHNIAATDELIKLQPALKKVVNTYLDDEVIPAPATVKQLLNGLGN